MSLLRRFSALSAPEKALFIEAGALTVCIRAALWLLPYPKLLAWLERRTFRLGGPVSRERIAGAVSFVSRYVPRATCLTQALAAEVLLRAHGYPALVRIGVAPKDRMIEAHAWVESEGRILLGGREAERFTAFVRTK
jgi:hypothetical protein